MPCPIYVITQYFDYGTFSLYLDIALLVVVCSFQNLISVYCRR